VVVLAVAIAAERNSAWFEPLSILADIKQRITAKQNQRGREVDLGRDGVVGGPALDDIARQVERTAGDIVGTGRIGEANGLRFANAAAEIDRADIGVGEDDDRLTIGNHAYIPVFRIEPVAAVAIAVGIAVPSPGDRRGYIYRG